MIGRLTGTVLLGVLLYLGYQGYENRRDAPVRAMGKGRAIETACTIDPRCVVRAGPTATRADLVRRRYLYRTSHGLVTVECRRVWIFHGPWRCQARRRAL